MRTRVQLEKNIFVEYYENGRIATRYEYNNNCDLIKEICYRPDSQAIWIIDEHENGDYKIFKRTIYLEDGKTIESIYEYNNGNCIDITPYDEDDKNYEQDDETYYKGRYYCFEK
jgi:hypothetical protein